MDTRSKILDAALSLFVEQGYEATTMQTIREKAGVSNGSLFHFFRSKEALGAVLYQEGLLDYQAGLLDVLEVSTDAKTGIFAFVRHHLSWVEAHYLISRFMFERGHPDWGPEHARIIHEANARTFQAIRQWLALRVAEGQLREQPMAVVMALLQGSVHALCRAWLESGEKSRLMSQADSLAVSLWVALKT